MPQYIYTMNRVSKVVPPKRVILRDISLSFFPGAKIGVLGLNGAGKSSLLRIMAGIEQTRSARGTLAHELQVLGGMERAELRGARIARLEQRDPLRQSARGEFPRKCRESVRSERMTVTESIAREALARDHGDAVHGE